MMNLDEAALRDAVHGDYKRLRLHASSPSRSGSTPTASSAARTGCRSRSTSAAPPGASASRPG